MIHLPPFWPFLKRRNFQPFEPKRMNIRRNFVFCYLSIFYTISLVNGHAHAIQTIICHLVKSITEKVNTYVLLKFKLSTNSSRHIGANSILSCKQCKNRSYKGGVSSGLCCCTACVSSELYVMLSNEKKIVIDC